MLKFSSGSVTVGLDDGIAEMAERLIRDVGDAQYEQLREHADEVMKQVRARWPRYKATREVSDGKGGRKTIHVPRKDHPGRHSADEIEAELVIVGDWERLRLRFVSSAEWWVYVQPRWMYGKTALNEMIRKPTRKLARRMIRERLKGLD